MMKHELPRIMLAAMHSGAGKTTVTCGLLAAFRKRGLQLRSFKCGPDYIDPMFHREVLGIPSGNLDSYFTNPARLRRILCQNPAELTVLEGVMGYYDGLGGISSAASSYEIAKLTDTPVLLIADARGVSVSLCAEIQGMQNYGDKGGSQIAGVILNRVSPMFYPRLKALVEENCGIPVLGYLPEEPALQLPSRHLGLVKPEELPTFQQWMTKLAASVETYFDLENILSIARSAGDPGETEVLPALSGTEGAKEQPMKKVKLALAEDAAFQFEYSENRALLERLGAELVPFSPLADTALPEDADGLILSGGYPENHAQALSDNVVMREAICRAVKKGMPTIAECGGFLYLSTALDAHEMCGIFPGHAEKRKRLTRFGYLSACFPMGGLFGPAGTCLRGHEFHYYDTEANGEDAAISKPKSDRHYRAGFYSETLYAGFPHFYLESNPAAAEAFMAACRRFRDAREAKRHWDQIAKPIDSLGKLEDVVVRLCALEGNVFGPALSKRGLLIFAADHGVLAENVSQTDARVSRIVAEELANGRGVTSRLAKQAGADVFVADVGLLPDKIKATESACHASASRDKVADCPGIASAPEETSAVLSPLRTGELLPFMVRCGSRNLAVEAAMTMTETEQAIGIGKAMVRDLKQMGYEILGTGEMGIGNTTATAAVFLGLLLQRCIPESWTGNVRDTVYKETMEADLQDEDKYRRFLDALLPHFVGRGAGLSDAGLVRKQSAVRRGLLRVHELNVGDLLAVLSELGGYEIAAMTGAFLGAAEENLPILVDGAISATAALLAACLDRRVRNVLIPSHQPREAVGRTALQLLALSPILDGDFALGEGSGTMLLLPLLDMALLIYREMGSFQDIRVPQYERFV